jgi:hypothetical protein
VTGGTQTSPGSAGNLLLTASQSPGGPVAGRSAGFTVAALPQKFTDAYKAEELGYQFGITVQDGWESDGAGGVAELDQVNVAEKIETTTMTGCFANNMGAGRPSKFLPGNAFTLDHHTTPVTVLSGPGNMVTNQLSVVNDQRTGATGFVMANSGMQITRTTTKSDKGVQLEVTKVGAAVSVDGQAATAGSASVDHPMPVPPPGSPIPLP